MALANNLSMPCARRFLSALALFLSLPSSYCGCWLTFARSDDGSGNFSCAIGKQPEFLPAAGTCLVQTGLSKGHRKFTG